MFTELVSLLYTGMYSDELYLGAPEKDPASPQYSMLVCVGVNRVLLKIRPN